MRRAILLLLILTASRAFGAFGYYAPVEIDHTLVPSDQTDFPVLISVTDATLKTVFNGGHVENASGFDIRPYADTGCATPLTYELERYNATTGEVVMWVKMATLSSTVNDKIYLAYGNTALSTDGSSTAVWSNNFGAVWHLKNGTTLNLHDSSATGNDLTNTGVTATTGQIDGGGGFVSTSSQELEAGSFQANAITYSAWVKATSFPAAYNYVISKTGPSAGPFNQFGVKSTGKLRWMISATTQLDADGTGSHTLSTGTWYYLTLTYDSSAGLVGYVNASSDVTVAANGNCSNITNGECIGRRCLVSPGQFWNGSIDEVRLASVARSADWITTEYNNQSDPSTFETLGAEVAGPCPTPTPTPTSTPTATATATATFTPTATATATATATSTGTPTATPTAPANPEVSYVIPH